MSYRDHTRSFKRSYPFNGNSGGSHGRPGPRRRQNDDFNLKRIDWSKRTLEPFRKDFYKEHPDVQKRSDEEVRRIRGEKDITSAAQCPKPITSFEESGLPGYVRQGFDRLGFAEPTPIQCQSWPVILSGRDMVGVAMTGSGKTIAFLVPSLIHINAQKPIKRGDGPIVLVVSPTRELATQTESQIRTFGESSKVRFTSVYGGVPKYGQAQQLRNGVDIVVATPGRLLDFLSNQTTSLDRVTYLVLDEADRMLDMGFEKSIRQIVGQIRPDRQTLLFSATWPKSIQSLASDFLKQPLHVNIGSLGISSCKNVEQTFDVVDESSKMMKTLMFLKQSSNEEKVLIFVATKVQTSRLCYELNNNGFYCGAISGDKKQYEREQVLRQFKHGEIRIMIGTDVASRGLDIKDITIVINYDFPNTIEDYVHRVGRTGRANAKGRSYTLMTRKNANKVGDLIELLRNDKRPIPPAISRLYSTYGGYKSSRKNYGGRGRGW